MTEIHDNAKSIFVAAIENHSPGQWPAYLNSVCGDNAELRERVEQLLEAHAALGSIHCQAAPAGGITMDQAALARPGTEIGPYKLLEVIGEGGMGVVYMAEQQEPVERRVALKIIKPGMDSRQVIARFEAERQALAMMDHPNIAKVLDAGTTGEVRSAECGVRNKAEFALDPASIPHSAFRIPHSTGRPYFVMELVKGVPITKYCDELHLTLKERLELFVPVCQAIQHAHQKGIIHRDVKPTNILVALYDGLPVPKVIDFGVAKATGQKLTEKTMFTGFGQLVGTLEYMSPEQAQFNQLDVDTRSDIYSLGVLLYELLTGSTPFDQSRLRTVAFDETLRIIREEEPQRPSTRLNSSDTLPAIAANRSAEPAQLRRQVEGDLDWIVMKSLEKDRNRRYESASGLALDIQRFLHDEPVQACPPSAAYRLRKFVRRNKSGVLIAGLTVCFLALLVGLGTWLGRERARRQATLNQEVAAAVQEAGLRGDQALTLVDAPHQWEATLAMASSALKRAEALVESDAALLDPSLKAQVQQLAARIQTDEMDRSLVATIERIRLEKSEPNIELSQFAHREATPKYRQAFASCGLAATKTPTRDAAAWIVGKHPPIRDALIAGLDDWLIFESGRHEQAWLKAVLAASDPDQWRNQVREARRKGDRAALEALAARPEASSQPPATLVILGTGLGAHNSHAAAVRVLRRAQERYPGDFWINDALARVLQYHQPPRWSEALTYYRIAIALRPQNAGAHVNVGTASRESRDLPGAFFAYGKAIELQPQYAAAHYGRGTIFLAQGDLPAAIAAFQKAIDIQPQYFQAHHNLANALKANGDLRGAISAYQKAIAIKPDVAEIHYNLGVALQAQGDRPAAIASYEKAIEIQPNYTSAHYNLGILLKEQGELVAAIAAYQRAVAANPDHAEAHCNLGRALQDQGKLPEALAELKAGHELGSRRANWSYPSGRWIDECRHLLKLDETLPAILRGEQQPSSAAEGIEFARVCALKGLNEDAVRLYRQSFAAQPELASESKLGHRYRAARAAALAGCLPGSDASQLGDAELTGWRQQAADWLRADLTDWSQLIVKSPQFRGSVRLSLALWQRDPELAGVRDENALSELPEPERATWQQLWKDVETLRAAASQTE